MTKRLLLFAGLGCVLGAVFLTSAGPAVSDPGDVTCTGPAPATVPHDLIVPSGATCMMFHTYVGHDVIVQPGGTLVDAGGTVVHDIRADQPAGIDIGGTGPGPAGSGSVGHDIHIDRLTGSGPYGGNFICNTTVGHDLAIQHTASSAAPWDIGDFDEGCRGGGVQVNHDANILDNANHVDVSENGTNPGGLPGGIGHDLNVLNNAPGYVVEGNVVGHDAHCTSVDSSDGDSQPNSARHNDGCTPSGSSGGGGGGGLGLSGLS